MQVRIGLVGKPNVGKSTLFSAATLAQVDIANYPFCTIDPNVGVAFVEARLPCPCKTLREKLLQRLSTLSGKVELDPARVAQEAAFLADRSDVTEELVRLEGHLEQARHLLDRPDDKPMGKRLEFLFQEVHREANTVCSKSGDLELTRHALAIKLEIEKAREQAQNLE